MSCFGALRSSGQEQQQQHQPYDDIDLMDASDLSSSSTSMSSPVTEKSGASPIENTGEQEEQQPARTEAEAVAVSLDPDRALAELLADSQQQTLENKQHEDEDAVMKDSENSDVELRPRPMQSAAPISHSTSSSSATSAASSSARQSQLEILRPPSDPAPVVLRNTRSSDKVAQTQKSPSSSLQALRSPPPEHERIVPLAQMRNESDHKPAEDKEQGQETVTTTHTAIGMSSPSPRRKRGRPPKPRVLCQRCGRHFIANDDFPHHVTSCRGETTRCGRCGQQVDGRSDHMLSCVADSQGTQCPSVMSMT